MTMCVSLMICCLCFSHLPQSNFNKCFLLYSFKFRKGATFIQLLFSHRELYFPHHPKMIMSLTCECLMDAVLSFTVQLDLKNCPKSSSLVWKILKSDYIPLFSFLTLFFHCLFHSLDQRIFSCLHGLLFLSRVNVAHQAHCRKKYFVLPQLAQHTKHQFKLDSRKMLKLNWNKVRPVTLMW